MRQPQPTGLINMRASFQFFDYVIRNARQFESIITHLELTSNTVGRDRDRNVVVNGKAKAKAA